MKTSAISKVFRFLLGAALVGGAGVLLFVYGPTLLGHAKAKEEPERPTVEVPITLSATVLRTVERRVGVVGTLEGYEEVNISPKVEGRVLRVHRDMGDIVSPGDLLAEIDPVDYQLSLNEAERGLEMELAKLGLTELCARDKLDLSKVPGVVRARNMEENARGVLERARRLSAGRGIGTEEYEKAQTEARVSGSNRVQAEMDARATLASARFRHAQVESAKQKVLDASIRVPAPSPIRIPPGVAAKDLKYIIASRKVAEGEVYRVFPSSTIFRLVIDQPVKLVASIPERFIGEVKLGQPVSLTTEAYSGVTFTGTLTRLNPTVERSSRSFSVEVTIPNEDRRLRVGSFVKASIQTRAADTVLTVPEEAIVRFAGVVKVFVLNGDKVRAVNVQTGEVLDINGRRWVEVIGSLPSEAQVVVSGQSMLAEGTPVIVRTEPRPK